MADSKTPNPENSPAARKRARKQEALNAFLVAAQTLAHRGEVIEAELRFKQALRTAETEFGAESDQTMLVLSILGAFYQLQNRVWDYQAIECRLKGWEMKEAVIDEDEDLGELGKRLVKTQRQKAATTQNRLEAAVPSLKNITPQIRKACQVLGLTPRVGITADDVNKAWKNQMLNTSAHPDLGGNTDEAVILNNAKQMLMSHLEAASPNLGKRFAK
ncbi:MAG TPA: hypothetical protein V6C72_10855 [Chroococcales cyanobacterium]